MEPLTFDEVAKLINRTGHTTIEKASEKSNQQGWSRYVGRVQSGSVTFNFDLYYLLADTIAETFRAVSATVAREKGRPTQVIYATSLEDKYPTQIKTLKEKFENTLSLSDYFSTFLRQQIEIYISRVKTALVHRYYVHPKVQVPSSVSIKSPNPVLSFLTDANLGYPKGPGALGILLAEPGQGKTYMTRYLAVELGKKKFIPVYVNSEQWSRMQADDLSSLWKTIANSFRYYDAPINWIEGEEEAFLKVALKAGLFRIIFDGFDEYVLWNQGNIDALEVIQVLSQLTDETGTRILITSRTSFWESEVASEALDAAPLASVYRIQPFDLNTAGNYFNERFPGRLEKSKAASDLFAAISSSVVGSNAAGFVGRGFFLSLIADLVDRSDAVSPPQENGGIVPWVMLKLCEREQERQKLPLTAQQQLQVFREFATLLISDEKPNSETLQFVIEATVALQPQQAIELVGIPGGAPGRLNDHPLINRSHDKDEWFFVQDRILYTLLAEVIQTLTKSGAVNSQLAKLCTSRAFATSIQTEVATALLDLVGGSKSGGDTFDEIRNVIAALLNATAFDLGMSATGNAASLACHIAIQTIAQEPLKLDKKERADTLRSLFPDRTFNNLCFSGTLAKYDFRGFTFTSCHFDRVAWANCVFDDKTAFKQCRFTGGNVSYCERFGEAKFEACFKDSDALSVIDAEQIRSERKKYSEDELRKDLDHLIRKFLPKEGGAVRTIEERNLPRGNISASKFRDEIIAEFKRLILQEHHISASNAKGYNVREEAKDGLLFYSLNGVFTGPLAELFESLKHQLKI